MTHKVIDIDFNHYSELTDALDKHAANGVLLAQILEVGKIKREVISIKPDNKFSKRASCLMFTNHPLLNVKQ